MPTRTERDDNLAADGENVVPAPWDERPILGTSRGLAWWGTILLALGLTGLGAAVDSQLNDKTPTIVTQAAYFLGCVAAVCWVRRRNLFGPIVQPPLVLAVVLIAAQLATAGLPKSMGIKDILLDYGIPVINNFPAMAVTTGVTVLIGLYRLLRQRDPERAGTPVPDDKPPKRRRRGREPDDDLDDVGLAAAAAPTRAARPVAPPAGRAPARGERPTPGGRPAGPAPGGRAAGPTPGVTPGVAPGVKPGRTTGENRLPGGEPRRGAAANRARPLEPRPSESAPRRRPQDSGPRPRPIPEPGARPRPQESGPHLRPDRGTLSPPPSAREGRRRQPPPARPWEAEQSGQPEPRHRPQRSSGQIPRKPPPPPREDSTELPPRRTPGRRPPPPPRSRRWDPDERG